jgi:hypothetical protein
MLENYKPYNKERHIMNKVLVFVLMIIVVQGYSQNYPITGINISLPASPDANTANWGTGKTMLTITATAKAVAGRVDPMVEESKLLLTIKKGGVKVCGAFTGSSAPAANFNTITKVWSGTNAVSFLGKDCLLAPGDYEICAQFFGYGAAGSAPYSEEKCKPFSIREVEQITYQPPQPTAPADGSEFAEAELQKPFIFRWIPVIPKPQEPVTYRLSVWQLMQGQTGTQAMQANQPLITKDVDNITQTIVNILVGGPCLPPYLCDFIWNVQALNHEGKPIGGNNGTSKPIVFSATRCECGSWNPLIVQNAAVVSRFDCNGKIAWKCNQPFSFTTSYQCHPNNEKCQAKTGWEIRMADGSTRAGSGTNGSFTPVTNGTYTLTLNAICNGKACQPCIYSIVVEGCKTCDCGEWSNSVVEIQAKDATTSRLTCSGTASLSKGIYQFHFPDFACNPKDSSCTVSYEWSVQGIASGNGTGQIFRFNFSQTGMYTVDITPLCGGKRCTPCKIVIKVEDIQPPPDVPKSLPDQKCENYSFELRKIYRGDSIAYEGIITNKYRGNEPKNTPKSFRIKIINDSVICIENKAPKEWNRTPSKFPPGSNQVKWTNNSGDIPQGETKLGTLYFAVPTVNPFYVVYEWLNKEGETLCKDSVALIDIRYYYELSVEPSYTCTEISNNVLRVQYINHYASVENIKVTIYDVEARKIKRKSKDVVKLNSVTGLNRISIDIKDYNLEPGRPYLLTISDFHHTYHFNFKVTNDREK